ncbi:glucosyltransferase [Spirochaetia bacterium]|nr:glucosyltransferase [Spirochaetia bacterium]
MDINDQIIHIVFTPNDYYAPYTAVTLQSVLEHSNNKKTYKIYFLHQDIKNDTIELLKEEINSFKNFSIEFINVSKYIDGYSFVKGNFPKEAYFRLLIPEIFSTLDKILYLDGDMICLADIAELYETELGDNLLASSRDITGIAPYYAAGGGGQGKHTKSTDRLLSLKISNIDDCFITGMLVINIKKFRKEFTTEELLKLAVFQEWQYADQDILNEICDKKTLLLPMEWDFTEDERAAYFPDYLKKEYLNAQKNIKIYHFLGLLKPWVNTVNMPFCELFWKYATRTPFIGIIIDRMQQNGFIGWHGYFDGPLMLIKRKQLGYRFIFQCLKTRILRNKKDK